MKKMLLTVLAFCMMGSLAFADTLIKSEKIELHNYTYKVNGVTIVCHYLKNPKLLSGKVNTGLSCVVLDATPVVVYKCWDDNHDHPQYEHQDGSMF